MRMFCFLTTLALMISPLAAQTTTGTGQSCPKVVPKNAADRFKMESTIDKNGCWSYIKNPDGSELLVFTSSKAPNENYKPLVPNVLPKKPATQTQSTKSNAKSPMAKISSAQAAPFIGTWARIKATESCSNGVNENPIGIRYLVYSFSNGQLMVKVKPDCDEGPNCGLSSPIPIDAPAAASDGRFIARHEYPDPGGNISREDTLEEDSFKGNELIITHKKNFSSPVLNYTYTCVRVQVLRRQN